MKKIILGCICWLLLSQYCVAQLQIYPNHNHYKDYHKPRKTNFQKTSGAVDTLQLPFFEDFSELRFRLDTTKWIDSGGVFINNTTAIVPPSLGVASFDGVDEFGDPYEFTTVINIPIGLTDELISCPIDLSATNPGDSTYLSFYWQREGLGEFPDLEDSLRLQFKNNQDEWITQWIRPGGEPTEDFQQVLVVVTDTNTTDTTTFLHAGFQFRFQAFGRRSGIYDVWHVDYIFMDQGRSAQDTLANDITCVQNPSSFLSRYTAMPLNQYFANPLAETTDTLITTINDLDLLQDFPTYSCVITDTLTGRVLAELVSDESFLPTLPPNARGFSINALVPDNLLAETKSPLALQTTFLVATGDGRPSNDSISGITVLDDYYAYDDGTAEYGAGVNQAFGQVAIRFETNEPDTITDIVFHLTKFEEPIAGAFNMFVWRSIDVENNTAEIIDTISNINITYPDSINQFISVKAIRGSFDPIPVNGVFYVGWRQGIFNDRLTFGFDRNHDSTSEIFFEVSGQWRAFADEVDDEERGSILLRPVFGEREQDSVITSVIEPVRRRFQVYPNPAQGQIKLEGELPERIQWLDLNGRLLFENQLDTTQEEMTLSLIGVAPGTYVLKAIHQDQAVSYRRILVY